MNTCKFKSKISFKIIILKGLQYLCEQSYFMMILKFKMMTIRKIVDVLDIVATEKKFAENHSCQAFNCKDTNSQKGYRRNNNYYRLVEMLGSIWSHGKVWKYGIARKGLEVRSRGKAWE